MQLIPGAEFGFVCVCVRDRFRSAPGTWMTATLWWTALSLWTPGKPYLWEESPARFVQVTDILTSVFFIQAPFFLQQLNMHALISMCQKTQCMVCTLCGTLCVPTLMRLQKWPKKQSVLLDLEYHGVDCSLTEIVILGERGTSVWGALPQGIANAWETIEACRRSPRSRQSRQKKPPDKSRHLPRNTELSSFWTISNVLCSKFCQRTIDRKCVDGCGDHLLSDARVKNKESTTLHTLPGGEISVKRHKKHNFNN